MADMKAMSSVKRVQLHINKMLDKIQSEKLAETIFVCVRM